MNGNWEIIFTDLQDDARKSNKIALIYNVWETIEIIAEMQKHHKYKQKP